METQANGNVRKWKREKMETQEMETQENGNARKWKHKKMETQENGNTRK
jgi:hypothetical protein